MQEPEDLPFIEFEPPRNEPWLGGLNPNVSGYRNRMTIFSRLLSVACAIIGILGCGLFMAGLLSPLPWLTLLVVCVVALAVVQWMRSHTEFCYLCGARTRYALAKQRLTWCPGCNNLNDPAHIGVDTLEAFDVTRPENFYHTVPILRFLAMTTCLAVLDKGHKMTYEPREGRYGVDIAIADETFGIEDPPAHIQFAVAQMVKAMAGLDMRDCNEAQEGRLGIRVYGRTLSADVLVEPTQFGQKVVLCWAENRSDHVEGLNVVKLSPGS